MIRNETEYKEAAARLDEERKRLTEHRARLKEAGLSDEEIKRVIDPMESFHLQLQEEKESYERLKRGEDVEAGPDAEEVERIGAVRCVAAGRKALGQRDAARRNELAGY